MATTHNTALQTWHLKAALAGWLIPGLGHFILGQKKRGAILCFHISALWLIGILMGGIGILDHQQMVYIGPDYEQRPSAWFLGQMLLAPTIVADWTLNHQIKPHYARRPLPNEPHFYAPSYGRMNEQGTLFTALAGLLNLLVILDVAYKDPKKTNALLAKTALAEKSQ